MNVIVYYTLSTEAAIYLEGKRGNAVDFSSTKKLDQVFFIFLRRIKGHFKFYLMQISSQILNLFFS
jgi:hypothetical protein